MKDTVDICEELLIEIMKRLPVKYILRCRSVQKSWYRLLRSPYFISIHSRYQHSFNNHLLFHNRIKNYFSLRFDDKQCKEHYDLQFPKNLAADIEGAVVAYETCNGLICLSATRKVKVYLWNPALRVVDVLPDPPVPSDDSLFTPITLSLAFGYLSKTNDYKVIKYETYFEGRSQFFVYVYSSSTDSWKTVLKGKAGEFACNKLSNSVVVNGIAYWVANLYGLLSSQRVIVCFDMENDTIREIMLPPPYSEKSLPPTGFDEPAKSDLLLENSIFSELLSLFYFDRSTCVLHIWVLENAGASNEVWTKKKSLNFERHWRPMCFRTNGEIVLRGCRKFLSGDLEKNEAKDIVDDDSLDAFNWEGDFINHPHQGINRFEESLVLLDVRRQA
ncbi:hypothetical protein POM88_033030 [Heracleum sosnowskyi]|uniref:F-box domain-containing protein n=1 Tax=Heracleum sosnowskyi TaxID=360622 RepID=A0AAD8I0F9_9APIA|nr:hypothetical protein POM88_033030 [Heracleum sosnowskyi]